ncbi:MAG: carbohydrate kinase family protein [Candidatus Cloacimonetes bacterium]|nr:carbohydrate kinase family protein [Candidatus Cloacimonadota bacterium]
MNKDLLKNTIQHLNYQKTSKNLLIGFDGFVDNIVQVVDQRIAQNNFTRIKTIEDFSQKISSATNLSANFELFVTKEKIGGNGPIFANALSKLSHKINYIGSLGKDKIHPIFEDFASSCQQVISIADPGKTDALEFMDGKLMFGKISSISDVNWSSLIKNISLVNLQKMIINSDLIAFTNWTMLPGMNKILMEFTEIISNENVHPYIFIDLADPQKRSLKDIAEILKLVSILQTKSNVILGLNENESLIISKVLNINEVDICKRAVLIQKVLNIYMVIIHPIYGAVVAIGNDSSWVDGPYTANPKLTTGAGDNFNAGFCHGILCGLDPLESLMTGVCTSGFYVRNSNSPSQTELVAFMEKLRF